MKFYFGLSKKIKLKWLITILLGLLAFFGIYKNVNAEELPSYYDISTDTFKSINDCNYSYAIYDNFTGGNLNLPSYITYNNLYSDSIVFDSTDSSIQFKQNARNSAYIDIKYHISTDIEHLYLTSKFFYVSYSSTSDRPEGASWYYCTDSSFSNCNSTSLSSLAQNNVYYANYYKNAPLTLTYNNTRYEYFILRLRGSSYGTSTNDVYKWQYITLSNTQIDTTNDSTISSASTNYCAVNNSLSLNSNLTDIIIDSINDSMDPLHSIEESLNNGVTINLGDNNSFKIPSLNLSSYTQRLFLLPITILTKVVGANEICSPYSINLSSFTNRFGGFNYTLTIPCMRTTISNMIGSTWYNIFDVFLCSFIFFKFAMFLVNQINAFINGDDTIGDIYYAYDETHNHYRDPITHVRYHYNSRTGEVHR